MARNRYSRPLRANALLQDLHAEFVGIDEEGLRTLVLALRRRGLCIADIADRIYASVRTDRRFAENRIHQILSAAPRRLRYSRETRPTAGDPAGIWAEP